MSDDEEDFGPVVPTVGVVMNGVAHDVDGSAGEIGVKGSSKKRLREDVVGLARTKNEVHPPSEYERSFAHSGFVRSAMWLAWSNGVVLVSLSSDAKLRWWIKLPVGLFLAKVVELRRSCSSVGEEVGDGTCVKVREEGSIFLVKVGGACCCPEGIGYVVDLEQNCARRIMPDMLELGPQWTIPWIMSSSYGVQSGGGLAVHELGRSMTPCLVVCHADEPKVSFAELQHTSGGHSQEALEMSTVSSGTMHPIALVGIHVPSQLLIVVDKAGIVDYVCVAEAPHHPTGRAAVLWEVLRGVDVQRTTATTVAPPPNGKQYISFASRAKTDFFAVFRKKSTPVSLSVGEHCFLLSCVSSDRLSLEHYCFEFSTGKLVDWAIPVKSNVAIPTTVVSMMHACLGEVVRRQASDKKKHQQPAELLHATWCLELLDPNTGLPSGSFASHTFTRASPSAVDAPLTGDKVQSSFLRQEFHGPPCEDSMCSSCGSLVLLAKTPVTSSQQLRNMLARSPLGSGLSLESIASLVEQSVAPEFSSSSSSSSTERGDGFLVTFINRKMALYYHGSHGSSIADKTRRDFDCSEIEKSFAYQFLQKGDSDLQSKDSSSADNESASGNVSLNGKTLLEARIAVAEHSSTTLRFRLLPNVAPLAVENFCNLCDAHFYDGLTFHRVISEFMIQGGCPNGNGTGGTCLLPSGGPFKDEFVPQSLIAAERVSNRGSEDFDWKAIGSMTQPFLLCMANCGPNTNQSQFFITTAPTPWLAGKHSVFGVLCSDGDVDAMKALLREIESIQVDREAKPLVPLVIASSRVVRLDAV